MLLAGLKCEIIVAWGYLVLPSSSQSGFYLAAFRIALSYYEYLAFVSFSFFFAPPMSLLIWSLTAVFSSSSITMASSSMTTASSIMIASSYYSMFLKSSWVLTAVVFLTPKSISNCCSAWVGTLAAGASSCFYSLVDLAAFSYLPPLPPLPPPPAPWAYGALPGWYPPPPREPPRGCASPLPLLDIKKTKNKW